MTNLTEQQRRRVTANTGRSAPARNAVPFRGAGGGSSNRTSNRSSNRAARSAAQAQSAPKKNGANLRRFVNFSIPQRFDFSFFLIVLILLAFGLIMLFSATYASANHSYGDSLYFVKRQLIFAGIGFIAMIVLSFIDYHFFAQRVILSAAMIGSATLMLLVRFMGTTLGGAERWLVIGGIQFQPSEILKFVTIMMIAEYMQRNYDKLGDFRNGFFPILLRIGISCGLVILQPHISCTVIIFVISLCMLCIGGAKATHLWIVVGLLAAGVVLVVWIFPLMGYDYITTRFLSFRDPEADILDKTFQTYQSLVTIGSGGLFGLGLGNSRGKYGYLPVVENDFIFSVICEELGYVGAILVILLFIIFVVRGFYIASSAPDKFGMLLCAGIVIQIGLQALLNIAVVSNAAPNTGISLPFISYGGTALIMQMAEMGIVLNISRKAVLQ
ncbi:MAG: putative lipid II flippase FtsW [Bacteroides sp.]|nr:putative lipid II flippase FtsW [Eubacterium sp.]MCM1418325.1 putative lipid II flippase FtsW [Roseburia sp.]MCM1463390.1 putative lipid II flippase FtsW [Bacteroides sp.]